MIVWVGTQIALSGNVAFDKLVKFIFFLSFGYALCYYYSTPIPGIGSSLTGLVTEQADYISAKLDRGNITAMQLSAAQFSAQQAGPAYIKGPMSYLYYSVALFLYCTLTAVTYIVILYGLVAQKILLMLGPFFVPWFIVPRMDWLMWGWLKAFLQFSFYQVIATCVVTIVGGAFVQLMATVTYPLEVGRFVVVAVYFLVAILAILKVPQLTASLFTGSAGGGDGGIVGLVQSGAQKASGAVMGAL
jgi:hypothetical protein